MASKKEQVIQSIEVTYDTTESVYDAIENICNLELNAAIGITLLVEDAADAGAHHDAEYYGPAIYLLREHLKSVKDHLLALHPMYQRT